MNCFKQILLYIVIFTTAFIASGEAYIYYLNSAVNDCDYSFECQLSSPELRNEYANELKKLAPELDLAIYAVNYKPISANDVRYEIYTINDQTTELVKNKLKVNDKNKFTSLLSGHLEIEFQDINAIKNNRNIYQYNVIGSEKNVETLRSMTIDKYGTGKPYEGGYQGDHVLILTTTWALAYVIIIFISLAESSTLRREICLKYINGYDWYKLQLSAIFKKSVTLCLSAALASLIADLFTEAFAFGIYLLFVVIGATIISAIIIIFNLKFVDIRKVFGNGLNNSKFRKYTSIILLSFTIILFIFSMAMCIQNFVNASKTIEQKNIWNKYDSYECITFFSKEETEIANHRLDNEYAAEFYRRYLEDYDISLAFNIAENGGMSEQLTNTDNTIVYMNLNGANKISMPVDLSDLSEDNTFYIITSLKEEELYEGPLENDLKYLLDLLTDDKSKTTVKVICVEDPYEITLLDIRNKDLARNCVKNPVILIDTHKTISKEFAANVCTAIMNFDTEDNFKVFIEEINYENQVWYMDRVRQLYIEKRNGCIIVASINAIIAAFLSVLFYITLYTVLKIEFQCRAEEIAIRKILGESLIKRYSFIFKILNFDIIIAVLSIMVINHLLKIINIIYIVPTLLVTYTSVYVLFIIFASYYESRNIPRILKGGY